MPRFSETAVITKSSANNSNLVPVYILVAYWSTLRHPCGTCRYLRKACNGLQAPGRHLYRQDGFECSWIKVDIISEIKQIRTQIQQLSERISYAEQDNHSEIFRSTTSSGCPDSRIGRSSVSTLASLWFWFIHIYCLRGHVINMLSTC